MLSKTDKNHIAKLDARQNNIVSHKGGWRPGEGVFLHGYQLLDDLVANNSYMQIVVLNATGKMVSPEVAQWIETIFGCMSWPDPRIWCNQIGALAGDTRASASAAAVAGTLAGDSRAYAHGAIPSGLEFILRARKKQLQGKSVEQITSEEVKANRGKPNIMGFARPLARGDERVTVLEKLESKLNIERGPHLRLAYDIEQELFKRFGESMNIVGYMSGYLADNEFTGKEIERIYAVLIMSGVTGCYAEYADQPQNTFLPLRCDDIDYIGPEIRKVSR